MEDKRLKMDSVENMIAKPNTLFIGKFLWANDNPLFTDIIRREHDTT